MREQWWRFLRIGSSPQPPHDTIPFSAEYHELQRSAVVDAIDSSNIKNRFREGRRLPQSYGVGLDERVVEYPWLFAQRPTGRVLDAGSSLNHPHILPRLLDEVFQVHVVTLAPEEFACRDPRVSYIYDDLRDLPIRDGFYDCIVSISTLEHVGMNNVRYGSALPIAREPREGMRRALAEFRRVLKSGGTLFATVPYGIQEDHGWFRQFDRSDVEELVEAISPRELQLDVFAYAVRGWQRSTLRRAATARYRDTTVDKRPAHDFAVAARAVACLRAVF